MLNRLTVLIRSYLRATMERIREFILDQPPSTRDLDDRIEELVRRLDKEAEAAAYEALRVEELRGELAGWREREGLPEGEIEAVMARVRRELEIAERTAAQALRRFLEDKRAIKRLHQDRRRLEKIESELRRQRSTMDADLIDEIRRLQRDLDTSDARLRREKRLLLERFLFTDLHDELLETRIQDQITKVDVEASGRRPDHGARSDPGSPLPSNLIDFIKKNASPDQPP